MKLVADLKLNMRYFRDVPLADTALALWTKKDSVRQIVASAVPFAIAASFLMSVVTTFSFDTVDREFTDRQSFLQRSPLNTGCEQRRFAFIVRDRHRLALRPEHLERDALSREKRQEVVGCV